MPKDKKEFNFDLEKIIRSNDTVMRTRLKRASFFTQIVAFLIKRFLEKEYSPIDSTEIRNELKISQSITAKHLNDLVRLGQLQYQVQTGNQNFYLPTMDQNKVPIILEYVKLVKSTLGI